MRSCSRAMAPCQPRLFITACCSKTGPCSLGGLFLLPASAAPASFVVGDCYRGRWRTNMIAIQLVPMQDASR